MSDKFMYPCKVPVSPVCLGFVFPPVKYYFFRVEKYFEAVSVPKAEVISKWRKIHVKLHYSVIKSKIAHVLLQHSFYIWKIIVCLFSKFRYIIRSRIIIHIFEEPAIFIFFFMREIFA